MRRLFWGIAIVLLGAWIWLSSLGVAWISFRRDWPLLIVALGGYVVYRSVRRLGRRRRRTVRFIIDDLESGRVDVEEAVSELKGKKK
ncbi:MAG TPA: hypothetical protein ENN51_06720 [candidate division WOR-3 bacterium]|uniref:LiaF transmembrane domain-containing protein n=1 Tax=candidate division WOR-3 bacterium TaxID=2052148 RepID=A0A7V0T6S4_UNCW3|nr:hypothetical protein [candidate division WOR-3 bacterium]